MIYPSRYHTVKCLPARTCPGRVQPFSSLRGHWPHTPARARCRSSRSFIALALLLPLLLLAAGCGTDSSPAGLPEPDPDNGGLILPEGFRALVVRDGGPGTGRHLAVRENGDIYMNLRASIDEGSMVAMRDTTGNGRADLVVYFGDDDPGSRHTGARIHNGYLYYSTDLNVYRYRLTPGELLPQDPPDTLVIDDHDHGLHQHQARSIAFDGRGNMYIPFGAPSNACEYPNHTPGAFGLDPCPELELHGGIWKFDENGLNQTQADGELYATGLRSIVAMSWNDEDEELYVVQHGRDHLSRNWPEIYTPWQDAMLPAEEFLRVTEGSDSGWPYCFFDPLLGRRVLAPEYGGDGEISARCEQYEDPLIGFPGHFAPNDLLFYRGEQFPDYYRNGAFIAFHGSTVRNPYPQAGYFVAFVPFDENGEPFGEWEVFANGFAGVDPIVNTSDAHHRPMGFSVGPDGSLYISDSVIGRVWRVIYTGDRDSFGPEHRDRMQIEKETATNIRTPHELEDNLALDSDHPGAVVYNLYCSVCHQGDGRGSSPRFPPLAGTDWVTGDKERLIDVIMNGLEGPIVVLGERYNTPMPAHGFLSDEQIADVATYIRQSFGNEASAVSVEEVQRVRERSRE